MKKLLFLIAALLFSQLSYADYGYGRGWERHEHHHHHYQQPNFGYYQQAPIRYYSQPNVRYYPQPPVYYYPPQTQLRIYQPPVPLNRHQYAPW